MFVDNIVNSQLANTQVIVKCCISCCAHYQGKESKTTFFTLPKVKPLNERKFTKSREGKLKAVINYKQRAVWINAMEKGYVNHNCFPKDNKKQTLRMCVQHFHSSTLNINEKGKSVLKSSASLIINLTAQASNNELFKEYKSLPRFIPTTEEELQLNLISLRLRSKN